MSTKIHNGFTLTPGIDVFAFVNKVREVMNPIRDRLDAKVLAELAVGFIDDADLAGTARPWSPLSDAFSKFNEEQRTSDKNSYLHDPNRFEMCLGADLDRILVLLHTERSEFRDAFKALDEVSEYNYWNHTDRPVGMSSEEWDARRDAWTKRMLPGAGVVAENMLSMTLRAGTFVGMLRLARHDDGDVHPLVLDQVPSKEWRAERLLRDARCKALDELGAIDVGNVWQALQAVEAGLPEVAAQVAPLLGEIGAADLTGNGTPADVTQVVALIEHHTRAFVEAGRQLPRS